MKANKNKPKTAKGEKNMEEKFPGYPKYDPREDITNNSDRVEGNLEDQGASSSQQREERRDKVRPRRQRSNNPSDVTDEDIEALGPRDLSMDMGDDEALKHRKRPVDFSGDDLDVPGSELDDADEEIGSEDEENNSYSLGGDSKENLEERKD